jgi:cation transport ATPase
VSDQIRRLALKWLWIFFLASVFLSSRAAISAEPQVKSVRIQGMVCSFCAQGLLKGARANPKISNVNVSLEKKTMSLVMKPGEEITDEEVQQVVQDAGLRVDPRPVERTEKTE